MKKPELLAPAGNMDSLKAAISAGCDAVYLGGKSFGARNFACNFSDEELIYAIKYAHIYGVKVYVTVNTLIFEREIDTFMKYIDFLHKHDVDAIIMQDLGMMDLVRQTYPNLEIHASTQMHIHNLEGVKLVKKLGLKRVVLARETNIEEIEKIKKETTIDIEVFVHGALCLSYSGQCLMSYFLGGRSGNRGTCAQCCRMPYDLVVNGKCVNKDQYLLSTRDLNTINNIGRLIEIGIDSLKIEGRMKRPEYVYIVTKLYRKAIDNYIKYHEVKINNKDIERLLSIFNRQFTKGFIFNEKNENIVNQYRPNHMGIPLGKVIHIKNNFITIQLTSDVNQEDGIRILSNTEDVGCILNKIYKNKELVSSAKKGDVISIYLKGKININDKVIKTTDKKEMEKVKKEMLENAKKVSIHIELQCFINKNLKIKVNDGINEVEIISDYLCQKAKTSPTTKDKLINQINRFKDTPYRIDSMNIKMDQGVFVDNFHLNQIRRNVTDLLNQRRCYKISYKKEEYKKDVFEYDSNRQISVYIKNREMFDQLDMRKINRIYSDNKDKDAIFKIPRIMNSFGNFKGELLIGELGSLHKYSNFITDFSFNVTNSYTVAFLNNLGAKLITLSYENTDSNIQEIIENYKKRYHKKPNLELIISSYPEIMVSKFNLLKQFNMNGSAYLKNKRNNQFKLESNNKFMTIYHYEKIIRDNFLHYYEIGIQSLRINLNDSEDLQLIKQITSYLDKKNIYSKYC